MIRDLRAQLLTTEDAQPLIATYHSDQETVQASRYPNHERDTLLLRPIHRWRIDDMGARRGWLVRIIALSEL